MKVQKAIELASKKIAKPDALWLMGSLLGIGQAQLAFDLRSRELWPREEKKFLSLVRARATGKPMQYIIGRASFYGRDFLVGSGVLIPRPETETLVEIAIKEIDLLVDKLKRPLKIFEVGVGSGCILFTLASERPAHSYGGTEPSPMAIKYAKKNGSLLLGKGFPKIYEEEFLNPVVGNKFSSPDIIISNPPYLDIKKDKVQNQVKKYEPAEALFSKNSGAYHAEVILEQLEFLKPKLLLLELSPKVATQLEKRARKIKNVVRVERLPDLNRRKRFLLVAFNYG